jgi:hypothetical protein
MRTLKIYLYEIVTGLALLGLSYVYLESPGLLPFAQVLFIALYVVIAAATEALIASSYQPNVMRLITLNVLVAAIVSASGWTTNASLKISTSIALGTLILRVVVAYVSVRAPKIVRRITAAFVGGTLLLESLVTVYSTIERVYYDYYYYPKIKGGYPITVRWQDVVGYAVFLVSSFLLLYLSYRLLKYAFRNKPAMPA